MPMSWAYAGEVSERESIAVIRHALELGVTHFDTADVYGPYTNEEVVGRALEGHRDDVVVATKVGLAAGASGGYPLDRDARPERILREVEGSLRRLRTDAIDLYYLHRIDEKIPFEDQWGAMASLVEAGTVRAIGLSEANVEQLETATAIHPVAALQSELSLWTRDPIDRELAWCRAHGTAFVPFAPLGRGYLTGAITEASFDPTDFRATNPRFTQGAIDANAAIVRRIRRLADRHGCTPAQIAIAWCLAQGGHVLPIPGTKRRRHVEENVTAASLRLSVEDLAELDRLPPSVAARY